MSGRHRLAGAHLAVAITAFALAACLGLLQALSIAGIELPEWSEDLFYLSVTAHGVLMALVFTTFFIMGLGYVLARESLGRLAGERAAWVGFWVALVGSGAAAWVILRGDATVLYTFYPPLQAHPAFYIGATLLVVGSWIWGAVLLASYRSWRREHRGEAVPLPVHGMLAAVIVWYLATAGLAAEVVGMLIPWSLGLVATIDPVVARTYFWWFGHPLTYFWLIPAYVVWYTVLPQVAGGRLFSDPLARMVFVLFILFSTPVGFHHQFTDPGIEAGWKLAHTFSTYAILYPSLVTAFTIVASLEVAGRLGGARGLFDWIGRLPWRDPFFSAVTLAMLTFTVGGFGGAINAAYAMNAMVHNTAWIQGHFHLTVGTTVALSFMGATYWLLPRLTGRPLRPLALARLQPWGWILGMALFSGSNHVAGLMGLPRRIYDVSYFGAEQASRWIPLTKVAALGAVILFASAFAFLVVVVVSAWTGRRGEAPAFEFARPLAPVAGPGIWDRLGLWTLVAAVLVALAYGYPLLHLLAQERFGSPGVSPF
ncbi:MAG: cbb3-type cytochrome c oxidase subunit I [Acidobacteriota bacterium]|nr:cbb3-type cytochrome c oxidase subunit I [Acidobacteriota bacterium]MDH3524432.1 cbb3-type cytochrome c oxidase subunit I [Acidobacteriota bacterium]